MCDVNGVNEARVYECMSDYSISRLPCGQDIKQSYVLGVLQVCPTSHVDGEELQETATLSATQLSVLSRCFHMGIHDITVTAGLVSKQWEVVT